MIKKRIVIICLFGCIALVGLVHAAVPLLALAPEVLTAIVVRSVGRQAVLDLGLAANDATWASQFGTWAANAYRIGSLLFQVGVDDQENPVNVELQMAPDEVMTHGPVVDGVFWSAYVALPGAQYSVGVQGVALSRSQAIYDAALAVQAVAVGYSTCDGTLEGGSGNMVPDTYENIVRCYNEGMPGEFLTWVTIKTSDGASPVSGELKDGVRRIIRDGDGWRRDITDPDWMEGIYPANVLADFWSTKWIQVSMPSSTGHPDEMIVDIAAAQNKVYMRAADPVADNQSAVRELVTNSNLVPITFTHQDLALSPYDLPDIFGGTQSQLPGGTTPIQIEFPSDYARDASVLSIASKLTDSVEVADPSISDSQFTDSFFKETFTNLLAWELPGHTSTCPVASFSWSGQTFTMDSHCQLINDHFGLFQSVMSVVWIIAAMFIVLRA